MTVRDVIGAWPGRSCRLRRTFATALAAGWLVSRSAADTEVPPSCALTSGSFEVVSRVIDGETIELESGRQVRLIGALAPRAFDSGDPAKPWAIEAKAKAYLQSLLIGRSVQLAYAGRRQDRYGRGLAHVFVAHDGKGQPVWVQGEMLSAGLARAYGLPDSYACGAELLAHERLARSLNLGLWALRLYQPKDAAEPEKLMTFRSRFEIVTGKVATVARTKSAAYLNFGADFKTDFTARVGKDVLSAFPALDQSLAALAGETISVRGWIERRNGPMIDITDPSQIERGRSDGIKTDAHTVVAPLSPVPEAGPNSTDGPDDAPGAGIPAQKSPGLPDKKPPGVDL